MRILSFVFWLLFFGCGKFNLSPYLADTPERKLNVLQRQNLISVNSRFGNDFKIAVLSDTHDYYDELARQIGFINRRSSEFAFVVITGDLTNLGLLREYEKSYELLSKLKVPYFVVPGNHDLLSNGDIIFHKMFGSADFSFRFKQTKFVFINNNNWETLGKAPNLSFLESALSVPGAAHTLLFQHVSPGDKARWTLEEKQEFQAITDAGSVDVIFNGHDHNPAIGTFGNARQVVVGSPVKGKLVVVSISNAQVEFAHVEF